MMLVMERRTPGKATADCELCRQLKNIEPWRTVYPATDMHEHFVNRGQAGGNPALLEAILQSKYNLSLLCNDCNLHRAETETGRRLLRSQAVRRYGQAKILEWMKGLPFNKESTRQEFVQYVLALNTPVFDPTILI